MIADEEAAARVAKSSLVTLKVVDGSERRRGPRATM
jgi:hypothetical protein